MFSRLETVVRDLRHFGPRFLTHYFYRLGSNSATTVPIRGIGNIHVRASDSDVATIRQVFGNGDYDISQPSALAARIEARYRAILASGLKPIIVDAGANIGAASLWFHEKYPDAAIVAIEPDPGNTAILRKNLDGRDNCVILEAAIGAERGFVALSNDCAGWAVQTSRAETGVRTVTVEDAFAASGGTTPFIVKIDIEGFEKDLFSTNLAWLDDTYVVILEPHDWLRPGEMTSSTFQKALAQHPFELFMRGENLFYVRV